MDHLHGHDCHQSVTEPQATGYPTESIAYMCTTQKLWVRPSQSILHTGWSNTCCKSYEDGMDRWKHSSQLYWHALPVVVARRDLSPVKVGSLRHESTSSMAAKTTETIHGLAYSVARTTEVTTWQSVDAICHCCQTHGSCSPFWINAWHKTCEIRAGSDLGKWSVQASKHAPSKHTSTRVQWSHASVGLAQARPNYSYCRNNQYVRMLWFLATLFMHSVISRTTLGWNCWAPSCTTKANRILMIWTELLSVVIIIKLVYVL